MRYPMYEKRHHQEKGWYVTADDGHLAHIPIEGESGVRAAIGLTEEQADAAIAQLNGTMA